MFGGHIVEICSLEKIFLEVIILRECPNCGKLIRDGFRYCRFCGSEMEGQPGDYSTDMLNVFKHDGEYMYLFSENGNQIVLKAGSMDELAALVGECKYPWEFRDWKANLSHAKPGKVGVSEVKSEFLRASSLKEPEIIPTASTRKKRDDESYVPEYEVERVVE